MIRHRIRLERILADRVAPVAVPIIVSAVVVAVFAAGLLVPLLPVRYPLAVFLAIAVVLLALSESASRLRTALLIATPVWTIAVAGFCSLLSPLDPPENDALFRYALLFPVAAVAGALLVRSAYREWFGRAFVATGLLWSVLATIEWVGGFHLVERTGITDALVRDGAVRAVVLSEHPLVLSALLAAAIPFAWALGVRWWLSAAASAVLVVGVLSTASRGGLVLAAAAIVLVFVVRRWPARSPGRPGVRMLVAVGLVGALAAILVATGFTSADLLTSDDPETASLQYRLVLYQKVLESLGTHPLGWGIGGLPPGVFLVPSPFGVHDLSVTVDSEIALIAFDAGAVGLVVLTALAGFLASRWVAASPFGQAAALLVAAGTYLALHAWTGLGLVVALVVGAALADGAGRAHQLNS